MECKLCKQDKDLIKKSHIIPNFMYEGIYDDKHQILSANLNPFEKERLVNTAPFDKNILCLECDRDIIGKYETYASKALYGGKLKKSEQPKKTKHISPDGFESIYVTNISYKKFKLFLLSILWRASISKHPFFKQVSLGKHEEIVRKMIFEDNPDLDNKYPTCVMMTEDNKNLNTRIVIEPRRIKVSSRTFYAFFINKAYYLINISSESLIELFNKSTIKENDTMFVPILKGAFLESFYDSFLGKQLRIVN